MGILGGARGYGEEERYDRSKSADCVSGFRFRLYYIIKI